jgi:hypothetical protein
VDVDQPFHDGVSRTILASVVAGRNIKRRRRQRDADFILAASGATTEGFA